MCFVGPRGAEMIPVLELMVVFTLHHFKLHIHIFLYPLSSFFDPTQIPLILSDNQNIFPNRDLKTRIFYIYS